MKPFTQTIMADVLAKVVSSCNNVVGSELYHFALEVLETRTDDCPPIINTMSMEPHKCEFGDPWPMFDSDESVHGLDITFLSRLSTMTYRYRYSTWYSTWYSSTHTVVPGSG
jgi:hypothetical protein